MSEASVRVTSPLYPELLVTDLSLTFVEGVAVVAQSTAEALRALPADLGLEFSDAEAEGEPDAEGDADAEASPKPQRSRAKKAPATKPTAGTETW